MSQKPSFKPTKTYRPRLLRCEVMEERRKRENDRLQMLLGDPQRDGRAAEMLGFDGEILSAYRFFLGVGAERTFFFAFYRNCLE